MSIETPVTFDSHALRLYGMLGRPDQPEPKRRGVVLVHGWAGYRIGPHRMLIHTADRLRQEGFATLRFDVRGRGDSEGEGEETSLDDMIEDTLAAAEFLQRETSCAEVVLLGICSGANVSIGAATQRPQVRELVLWSILPFQPEAKATQKVRRARFYLGGYLRKALRRETWARLFRGEVNLRGVGRAVAGEKRAGKGERNLKDSSRNLMAAFAGFKGRALFIAGSKDPEGMTGRELFMPFTQDKGLRADFHLVDGATHSYYATGHEIEVIDKTVSWLKS